ncbi:reverse transcriptase domain-containing protein [Tanacetum coccineum]
MVSGSEAQPSTITRTAKERIIVAIHPEYPEQIIAIGSTLIEEGRKELCSSLRRNLNIFAWKTADMTGVQRHIAEHRLSVREGCLLVRQNKRSQAQERNKAIQEEVEKLVDAGIMKEVHYHRDRLEGGIPLWIPLQVLSISIQRIPSNKMAKEDEEKTTFITSQGIFCYSKIPFGLKNAGATYQRLVDKAFQKQIGKILEVYMDDLVIKSRTKHEIVRDIEETFKTLRKT